jgi:hypothetical protein
MNRATGIKARMEGRDKKAEKDKRRRVRTISFFPKIKPLFIPAMVHYFLQKISPKVNPLISGISLSAVVPMVTKIIFVV